MKCVDQTFFPSIEQLLLSVFYLKSLTFHKFFIFSISASSKNENCAFRRNWWHRKTTFKTMSWPQPFCYRHNFLRRSFKDDSDYLAFKETTCSYSKFVYCSTFLCKPVLPRSQPSQICCTMITNMQMKLRYVHLYNLTSTIQVGKTGWLKIRRFIDLRNSCLMAIYVECKQYRVPASLLPGI